MLDLERIVLALDQASTLYELKAAMRSVCSFLGFDHYVLATSFVSNVSGICRNVIDDVPTSFRTWYRGFSPDALDPVMQVSLRGVRPIFSDEILGNLNNPEACLFLKLAGTHGLEFSLSTQQHDYQGATTVCTYWRRHAPSEIDRENTSDVSAWIICHLHDALSRVFRKGAHTKITCGLTEAERTCLTLRARGQDKQSIAQVLGVSPRTVVYYIGQSMRKLGARKPAEAVTKALLRNEIQASDLSPRAWHLSDKFIQVQLPSEPSCVQSEEHVRSAIQAIKRTGCHKSFGAAAANAVQLAHVEKFAFVFRAPGKPLDSAYQLVVSNYPVEYLKETTNNNMGTRIDPMFHLCEFRLRPFFWTHNERSIEYTEFKSLQSPTDGTFGLTAMTRSSGGAVSALTLKMQKRAGDLDASTLAYLGNRLAAVLHERAIHLNHSVQTLPELTTLEVESLCCLASGHGFKSVACLLKCSTRMARYHLKKIAKKFGVSTVSHAVSCAAEHGLLLKGWSTWQAKISRPNNNLHVTYY